MKIILIYNIYFSFLLGLLGFHFLIAHFLFLNGDVAHATSFGVYISQFLFTSEDHENYSLL